MGNRTKILLLTAVASSLIYILLCLFLSRWHYQAGRDYLEKNDIAGGEAAFTKGLAIVNGALGGMPQPFVANDLQRLHRALGAVYFRKAASATDLRPFHDEMLRSESHYQTATEINPYDVEAAIGQARASAALEKVGPLLKAPATRPALPLFYQALQLRPNGLEIHYLLIRYLYEKKLYKELNQTVADLLALQPQVLSALRNEPFFKLLSPTAIEESLQKATLSPPTRKAALAALSGVAEKKGDLAQALFFFRQYLDDAPQANTASSYSQLGRLHLKADQLVEAFTAFATALRLESDKELMVNTLWNIYRSEKKYTEFLQFCDKYLAEIETKGLREVVKAKALIELTQYALASFHLAKIAQESKYRAEGYFLQAGIAEKTKDWDDMELAAHQATVLAPQNSSYHLRFSQALKEKKKFPQAELAADRAIAASEISSPWLYNHRAWLRWQRNNHVGATQDWEEAIRLKPDDPGFHYSMALAYERLNDRTAAIDSLHQAIKLKPNEATYQEKLKKLKDNGKP